MKYAKVAVELTNFSFDKEFDYIIPPELEASVKKGCRVTVPFGQSNKKRIGFVFNCIAKMKPIHFNFIFKNYSYV